jgi:hypothetical protein
MLNIGYTLQSVDLFLQSKGYGSLWSGMGKPTTPNADYRILLGFGNTNAPLRKGESEFKRRPILDISNEDNAIARAARLAPSAANFQPWKLVFSPRKVIVQPKSGGIGKMLTGKAQKIDLGICLRHIALALEHEGNTIASIAPESSGKSLLVEVSYQKSKG